MSVSSIIDQTTGKIYDDLIPQGGGIPLTKGQLISADATGQELAVPVGANGTILQADDTQADGLRWVVVPGAVALAQGQLLSANAGGDATIVPAPNLPAQANYVLSADATAPTNLLWKPPTGAGGLINATAPLVDDAGAGTNTISINFTAGVKGELVAGNGTEKTGALVPPAGPDNYVLTSDASTLTGLSWKALAGSGVITAIAPLQDLEPVAGTNEISIAFTANVGEIPYGTGVAKTGALTGAPNPASSNQYLGTILGVPTWKDVASSGTITATAPLVESAGVGGASNIAINFTAVKGEIPAGDGTAGAGALVPAPATNGYVLTADSSTTTGLKWAQGGAPSAQTNFFPLTYPPQAGSPFVASGFDVSLPPPSTIGTFTQNEQITIMNYEPTSNPTGNSFIIAQDDFEDMTAFWTGNNTGGLENFAYFTTGTNGAPVEDVIGLYNCPLPLSGGSLATPIASFQVGPNQLARCNGIIRTASYLYFFGNFTSVVVISPASTITDTGGIIRYNMTTGAFSRVGGAVGGLSTTIAGVNPPDIFCATLCPTTDGLFGNYATNPRTMVLGGTFNTVASNALSVPYICFYHEPTDTFSVCGDGVGDGINSPAQVAVQNVQLKYGITSLIYRPVQNDLWVAFNNQTFIWTTDGGTQTFQQDNCVGGFIWKGGAGYSLGVQIGTAGQITNPRNLYFANGMVKKVIDGKYWLCIGFTDAQGQNCWWKDLSTPNLDPLIAPSDTTTPPPLQVGSGGADIPNSLQYTYGRQTDGSSYVAFMNFQINALPDGTSTLIWDDFAGVGQDTVAQVKGTPETATAGSSFAFQYLRPVGQTGSWTFIANSQDFIGLNTSLLPAYCLVYNVASPEFFAQKDLEDQSVGVLLFPGNGVQYIIPSQPTATAFSVNFKQQYTSLQLVVDLTADIYRVVNLYGDLEFSKQ